MENFIGLHSLWAEGVTAAANLAASDRLFLKSKEDGNQRQWMMDRFIKVLKQN